MKLLFKHHLKLRPQENFVSGFWKESIYSTNTPLVQVCWAKAADADFHDNLLRGY